MASISLVDNHLVWSAAGNAQRAALTLFSIASTVFPGDNKNLVDHFLREAIEAGVNLALNARKVLELCHLQDVKLDQTRWKYDFDQSLRETSFRDATNRFVHAKQLKIRMLGQPDKIFGNDVVMTEFMVTTDRRATAHIDIFGFAWTYLSQVAPQIERSKS